MPPGEYRKQMNKKNMIEHVENINHDQILMQ
jgi:hypothetical protein